MKIFCLKWFQFHDWEIWKSRDFGVIYKRNERTCKRCGYTTIKYE